MPEDYIEDSFNLIGLSSETLYKESLEMILDVEPRDEDEYNHKVPDVSLLVPFAAQLYGRIHQRYITTQVGLQQVYEKYRHSQYEVCPRYLCYGTQMIPCGQHDILQNTPLRMYCPNCQDIYASSRYSAVDGSHFGTTFPHLFMLTFGDYVRPSFKPLASREADVQRVYEPRLFGFRIHPRSVAGPRAFWLRS